MLKKNMIINTTYKNHNKLSKRIMIKIKNQNY